MLEGQALLLEEQRSDHSAWCALSCYGHGGSDKARQLAENGVHLLVLLTIFPYLSICPLRYTAIHLSSRQHKAGTITHAFLPTYGLGLNSTGAA